VKSTKTLFRVIRVLLIFLALALCGRQAAGKEPPILRGEWVATAGPNQILHGRWVGQALPDRPNLVHGSWMLLSDSGNLVLSGTWSARKTGSAWQGTWSAQDEAGRRLSGAWKAELTTSRGSLGDLLEQTLKTAVSGLWRSGQRSGHWRLRGLAFLGASRNQSA
jgi:hypothetical protein